MSFPLPKYSEDFVALYLLFYRQTLVYNEAEDESHDIGKRAAQLAFPNGDYRCALVLKLFRVAFMPIPVAPDFFDPECAVGDRDGREPASVSMPKTSMDKDGDFGPRDPDVRGAGKALVVEPIAS